MAAGDLSLKTLGLSRAFILLAVLTGLAACGEDARSQNSARAAAVIAQAGGQAAFVDASTAEYAAVLHRLSGLECVVPRDGEFSMEEFPRTAAHPGMTCSRAEGEVATMFVVVYYGAGVPIDTAFAQALQASAGQASPQPWAGAPSAADKASPEGLPHFRIARFSANVAGQPSFLRVAMAEAQGWFLQQVTSGPIADAEAIEASAGQDWRRALHAFGAAHQSAP